MRVLEVFGGQSAEHDVSVASGWAVAGGLREAGHHVTAAHIDRGGRWRAIELDGQLPAIPQPLEWPDADPWALLTRSDARPDVLMAVLHGPRGEDGVIGALARLADVACVGSGLASSAVCLDKTLTRDVLDARGIAQTRWLGVYPGDRVPTYDEAADRLGSTVLYIKPANLGSSIGISRVADVLGWDAAISHAASYDDTLIIEAGVEGRELSVSILGDRADGYEVSEVSETRPHGEFLDHADKYGAGAAMARVPADLGPGAPGQRGQHDARVHHRIDLPAHVGGVRRGLSPGARPPVCHGCGPPRAVKSAHRHRHRARRILDPRAGGHRGRLAGDR